MRFLKREIFDLAKAWILISIAFTILFRNSLNQNYSLIFIISLLTAGIGFLLHELAHKFIAQRYNYYAEFHSFDRMLILAIVLSFFGFIFAAPGAVFISGNITKRKNGIISLAGPLTNIVLSILFLILMNLNILTDVSNFGFRINSLLALFNMLPFFSFDGKKVFDWNKLIYTITVLIALFLVFVQLFSR